MRHFDLFVIGAGPGGYEAALEAAGMGKTCAVAEEREIGGVCLNRGCIPTKSLLKSARLIADLRASGKDSAGLPLSQGPAASAGGGLSDDPAAMLAKAAETEKKLREGIEFLLKKGKVELFPVRAKVIAPGRVLAGEEEVSADHILLATGSRPAMIPVPGADLPGVYTSDDLLTGSGVNCRHLVIVGGGVIGAEFAEFYRDLGREVTVIEALPRLLPKLDRELGQSLAMSFRKRGIDVHTGALLSSITADGDTLRLSFTEKDRDEAVSGDAVLLCTGRRPNTEDLFAGEAVPEMTKGYVMTDGDGRTSLPGIWAIGDIAGGSMQLAHTASNEGKRAVHAMFGDPLPAPGPVPSCIFTEPEIASVGLTQEEAKEAGISVISKKALTSANGRSMVEGTDRGFAKLIWSAEDHRLLGAQLMCAHASEMIGGLGALIRCGATAEDLSASVWPHPTVSEIIAGASVL